MKIEGNRPSFDPSLDRVDQKKTADAAAADAARLSADRIRVSAEAQLANDAVKAATDSSDVRPEVVERAKKLLDAGRIGQDAGAIADALIKSSLES
ncbi:MAG: flagellar biosynthesis anti-sigma factor FlgM [Vicinamibacterales bacterium]